MQDFQKLKAWQRASALALKIDVALRRSRGKGYGSLKNQLSRAADSIATNIVEGSGAATQREFARYLDISIKSCSETQHHLISARDRGLLPVAEYRDLVDEDVQIRRMLFTLRKRVLENLDE